jgi:hypothetical protein
MIVGRSSPPQSSNDRPTIVDEILPTIVEHRRGARRRRSSALPAPPKHRQRLCG